MVVLWEKNYLFLVTFCGQNMKQYYISSKSPIEKFLDEGIRKQETTI